MPNKLKKDKESSKSGKSSKSGHKNIHEGSNKKTVQPPTVQMMRVKPGSNSGVKRERRISASVFPISVNRELNKMPPLKGTPEMYMYTDKPHCLK
ncbi:hypothetical protein UPYG_G00229820 [Umbra pygmaea]|uniref:Uncharacterized protein n=1 Tax=Umbra pygmaea TaxID=75934 RepID=A0ABD0WZB7_UMBPY